MTWQTTFRSAHVMHRSGVGKDATCTPTPKGDCHQKLTAMDTPPLSIWCHQPSGMKIASPACSGQSRALHTRDAMPLGRRMDWCMLKTCTLFSASAVGAL